MDSRERVFTTLEHKTPDRVPLDGWILNSVLDKLFKHFNIDDLESLLEKLGFDFRSTCMLPNIKKRDSYSYFKKMGLSICIDDYYVEPFGDSEYVDEWGVRIKVTGPGDLDWKYSYHPLGSLKESDIDSLEFPDLDEQDRFEKVVEDVKKYKDRYVISAGVSTIFRKSWILTGFSNFLQALYTERGFVEKLADRLTDFYSDLVARYIDHGVDLIQLGGDLGTENSMMISPDLWREVFKPRLKSVIQKNKKKGIYFYLHSDGDISPIIPDLIDIGLDIINPIQPECIDPARIKEEFGDRLTLHGTMSLQKTFASGTTQDIKEEILDRIENCGQGGGLILAPSNAFTDDIPLENIIFFYDFVKNFKL